MKTDARVRYTKMRIREAFFACLREKPVSRITVKELCDAAEINRATFYTHYKDPFDLLEKLEEATLEDLRLLVSRRRDHGEDSLLLTLLQGMQGERSETRLLASRNGDPSFGARISALFYETYLPRMEEKLPNRTEAELHAIYRFIAGGCANLLTDWVSRGMLETPKKLAEQMEGLTAAVMTAYTK